jgi:hypothetical protein
VNATLVLYDLFLMMIGIVCAVLVLLLLRMLSLYVDGESGEQLWMSLNV